ncbi:MULTISPECIES: OmpA family protein [Prochlorococcus]|uniref:OmpA family protein n=2 Tax=Prochlorococcaceae TaxID=2881426 RepID=UPI0007BB66BD|nr:MULTISPECIES: OmpA family protein [Prochlorococcus]NMP06043.1 OmpA family protein [Prochlorococcus sp. P1361]KZR67247.1 Photosystem I P700 chlorophyll a apoprotein A2 [Prochlorococcus marinus str. MIT 1312]KZR83609.1 Photosystem I P700 chlorophyll a apoprotein A2 [Prochlorococcus marinus str. MIT 1327]NMO83779.1 OmpA family protein [Prochlorococcus sp. P1344]NMP12426.1 OmpA family protein [Prochlorococcus sp.P1363]
MSLPIRYQRLFYLMPFSVALMQSGSIKPIQAWVYDFQEPMPVIATSKSSKLENPTYKTKQKLNRLLHETHDLVFDVNTIEYSIEDLHIVIEKEREILIELAADVLFDFDKANLKPSAVTSLETVAKRIHESSRGDVRIEGHTDSKGSNEYNQTLSEKRAISVRDWFVSDGGLSNVQFVTKGFGELKPVVSNTKEDGGDDPIGRQRNRRVEIIIKTVD